jgi:hypothetical protein
MSAQTGGAKKKQNMNRNYRKMKARFGPETRFEVKPVPAAPFRPLQEKRLELLKRQLVAERLDEARDSALMPEVKRAANEAAALAWGTAYPSLVFPELFTEKIEAARSWAERQEEILERSRVLLAA